MIAWLAVVLGAGALGMLAGFLGRLLQLRRIQLEADAALIERLGSGGWPDEPTRLDRSLAAWVAETRRDPDPPRNTTHEEF